MYKLLDGYRIVEAAAFIAGPSCGLHLAQMGAQVIRVDAIGGGPDYHRWPLSKGGDSLYWEGLNKAKKSIMIDLRKPAGRELLVDLASAPGERAGLFVTNLPERGSFSHQAMAERRGDMVTARIMGWPDGSPAVDYTVNAAVGVPAMTGPADDPRPVNHVLPAWDLLGGAYAAFALCAAAMRRHHTGVGAELKIALSDLAATSLGHLGNIAEAIAFGDRARMGNELYGAFGRDFVCADGARLMVVAITPSQWSGLVSALQIADEIAAIEQRLGVRFAQDEGARFVHRGELYPAVEAAFTRFAAVELGARFDAARVTWSRYRSLAEAIAQDPRIVSGNAQFQTIRHPSGLDYPAAGPPAAVASEAAGELRAAPRLGEDTDAVLHEVLGLTSRQIGALRDAGTVA